MAYSGEVSVGGVPDVHELTDLIITKIAVGPMQNNAYVLRCRATDEQLLIDAANDAERLLDVVGRPVWPRWSPPTSTATTGRRCGPWSTPPAPVPTPAAWTRPAFPSPPTRRSTTATPSPSAGCG